MSTGHRLLVAGLGNVFLGDDGFGVEVVRQLALREQRPEVRVADFGIRGIDLTYALLDGYEGAILIDATARGRPAGTLYVLEPVLEETPAEAKGAFIDPHSLDPSTVLATVQAMGGRLGTLRVVGCEPQTLGSDDEPALGLSEPVAAAIEPAVEMVEALVARMLELAHA